jgi:hypothetical protein
MLPEPLAALVLELVANRRHHREHALAVPRQTTRPTPQLRLPWRTTQEDRHPRRPRPLHSLFALATEIPAAILARMLGIHIQVAVQWQRASAGDWMTYAADISRRSNKQTTIHDGETT